MDSKPSDSLSSDKIESNGVNSVTTNAVVDNNNINSNLKSVVVSSDDETEGFASGEEEAFETVIDNNNNKSLETLANVDEGEEETFSEPSEFPLPKTEAEDDAEKVRENTSDEAVVENGVKVNEEGDSVVEEVKVETPAPGVAVVTANSNTEDEDTEDEDVLLVGGSDEGN